VLANNARQVEIALFLRRIVASVIDWATAWHRQDVLSRELSALPDYVLKDIGIRRDQIGEVAMGHLVREAVAPTALAPAPVVIDDNDIDHPLAA